MITIFYKCHCMPGEKSVEVPARPPGSDILIWMGVVQNTLSMVHAAHSPKCTAKALEYAKIPVEEGAEGIGEHRRLQS